MPAEYFTVVLAERRRRGGDRASGSSVSRNGMRWLRMPADEGAIDF